MSFVFPFGWNQNKALLVAGNVFFGLVLIMLANAGVLPLDPVNFIFFSFVAFLFALYRPGWTFLFFVGMIPFETANMAPVSLGIDLRPYQWLALLLFLAVMLRSALRKLPFELVRPRWFDWLLLMVPLGAFIAAINAPSPGAALKQAVILLSFGLVYAIGRIFWQSLEDVRQAIPFFISSSAVVFGYALWQNVRFLTGQESFQVMTGRPNATFSEADWLGMFAVVALGIAYFFFYLVFSKYFEKIKNQKSKIKDSDQNAKILLAVGYLILTLIVLIVTVARSAWLGAFVLSAVFCLLILFSQGRSRMREMLPKAFSFGAMIVVSSAMALGLAYALHLTSFQLFNRVQSTASGLQKITVACERDIVLPEKIGNTGELAGFGCRHIDLEAIEAEKRAGMFVSEVYRNDPNVSIRKEIYGKAQKQIGEHPVQGIGWGSIATVLGTDERGAGLNASNMFFEIWLGSGFLGLAAFSLFWFGTAFAALRGFSSGEETERPFLIFILAAWTGMTVFNLFNSGILLGFFFLYLALSALILQKKS